MIVKTRKLEPAKRVAPAVGVKPNTLLAWFRRGWVPGHRAGLHPVLFDIEEVLDALARRGKGGGR